VSIPPVITSAHDRPFASTERPTREANKIYLEVLRLWSWHARMRARGGGLLVALPKPLDLYGSCHRMKAAAFR